LIRTCTSLDVPALTDIYNHYIEHTIVTFEEVPLSRAEMGRRVDEVVEKFPWLVLEVDGRVVGFAHAKSWNPRSAYRRTVESTIYLDMKLTGRGFGRALYSQLIDELRKLSIHRVIAGIALPNDFSVRFHERLAFVKSGHFNEVGYKQDRWVDVGYWILEL